MGEAGYDLGNHSLSHIEMNNLTIDQVEQEIIGGEGAFVKALAKARRKPLYFRFPENHTGDTKEKHDTLAAFLAQRGYRLAPCTIDNEDYIFNAAYLKMLANKDEASAARLRAEYLAYTATETDYYSGVHKQIFGHEIPHVMLLHVNKLNADMIDRVLALFAQKRYRFVSLDSALADPAYSIPDQFVTKEGWMWAYRWAKRTGCSREWFGRNRGPGLDQALWKIVTSALSKGVAQIVSLDECVGVEACVHVLQRQSGYWER